MASEDNSLVNLYTAGNIRVLAQGLELIARLDDLLYARAGYSLPRHGVGSHFRHCLDFYQSFLAGVGAGHVNYDIRERDEEVEKDRASASARIRAIIKGLRGLPPGDGERTVHVMLEGSARRGAPSPWTRSSVARELQFLLSHTVHHFAIIAFALRQRGFEPGEEFGVAPSTLEYWRQTA